LSGVVVPDGSDSLAPSLSDDAEALRRELRVARDRVRELESALGTDADRFAQTPAAERPSDGAPGVVFSGRLVQVVHEAVTLPSGKTALLERARRPPGVRILARQGARFLVIDEYRRELGRRDLRLPGGKVFDTLPPSYAPWLTGPIWDAAEQAARRELQEECGLRAETFARRHISKCGATVEWDLYFFVASGLAGHSRGMTPEDGEDIAPVWLSRDDLISAIHAGRFSEDRSVGWLAREYLLNPIADDTAGALDA
jgi:ADP-ribose pyrophosphatase